jgi:peptide-methionine (R)-S-oxide reductase
MNKFDKDNMPKTEEEWKKVLTPEQYEVLRGKGTERAFTGIYDQETSPGIYHCAACGAELFDSKAKYDAGCGWPSFFATAAGDKVKFHDDSTLGMQRIEVTCANCGSHLGHIFDDGPSEHGGKRFCINSASLDLEKKP